MIQKIFGLKHLINSNSNLNHLSPSKKRAVYELILASALWGFGFIAVKWAFESFSSFALLFLRFTVTSVVGLLIAKYILKDPTTFEWKLYSKAAWRSGLALCLLLWLQTVGLESTSAVNSSFITALYVIHVPIIHSLIYRQFHMGYIFYGLFALIGVLFLIAPASESLNPLSALSLNFSWGDVLTFGCSVAAALQILAIEVDIKKVKSFFNFNNYQFLMGTVFLIPLILLETKPFMHSALTGNAVAGLLSLIFGSSLLAFFLQVRSQTAIESRVVSFLFLLEAPFATVFAIALLGESLSINQMIGTLMIFASCFLVLRK